MPERYNKALAAGIKPDPMMTYAEWADKHFYLGRESSPEPGRFRVNRTPYIKEPLEALSPQSKADVVVVIKPTQQAGTTTALIFLCGMIDMYPGPALMIMPTDAMCKSFSKKKLTPSINATKRLIGKIAPPKSRSSDNTIKQKDFPGGSVMLSGSNSGASYRSESIKYLIVDDYDGCPGEIAGEGDTEELADRRTGAFSGRKVFFNSTTTLKGASNIEKVFEDSSQGYFSVPCPHCGHYQYLRWGGVEADFGIKFIRNEVEDIIDVWYECESCHGKIHEHHKTEMLEKGKYIHKYPDRVKVRGFRYNALMSPVGWINSWSYIAKKYLIAVREMRQGNPVKYQAWLNTLMAESYEERGEQPEWTSLKARCEPYKPMTIPDKARVLTSGTDVHPNRLITSVYAWGPHEESWLIYHVEIVGDPMYPDVWEQHDQLIYRSWRHASGIDMRICSAGVDAADGNTTQAVRNYCRFRAPIVFALQGQSQAGKPIIGIPKKQDLTWNGEKIEGGVEIWPVGSDTGKSTIYSRLKITKNGPGKIHFYIGTSDEFFEQLTAEKIVTRLVKGYPVKEWHNIRGNKRNEAIDTAVYAYAAAVRVGVSFMDFNRIDISKDKQSSAVRRQDPPKQDRGGDWFKGSGFGGGFGSNRQNFLG